MGLIVSRVWMKASAKRPERSAGDELFNSQFQKDMGSTFHVNTPRLNLETRIQKAGGNNVNVKRATPSD